MSSPAMRIAGDNSKALPVRVNLTITNVENAACPPGVDRFTMYDARVPGLALRVTPNGTKTFTLIRKLHGQKIRVKLGTFPQISIEQARKLTDKRNGEIADGKDPRAARWAIRESMTLRELFDEYKKKHLELKATERTLISDESRFDTCFNDWEARKVATLAPALIRAKHADIARKRGQVTANRAIQLLRRMFNWKRIDPNPVVQAGVDFFQENERERFMQADELPKFFEALEAEPNETMRDFFKLCLFTGARRSNVASSRWDELHLERGEWVVPADKSKSKKPMTIHLSPSAMEVLEARKGNKSDFVFPSHGASGHIVEPKKAWDRILTSAGIKDLHLHDLRRTLGSWQAAGGASLQVIGKSLGHRSLGATAIYSRLNLDPVRESVNNATIAMLATMKPAAKPVNIKQGRKTKKK